MKLKTTILSALLVLGGSGAADAQVGIGTKSPHGSAALDVEATDKGFLPPRMTEAEANAINNPAEGLTIYNTDDNCLNVYVGHWRDLCAFDNTQNTGTISHNGNDYQDVYNAQTGQTWLDRNLGATQLPDSVNDPAAKGSLFQWGRAADGHEARNSATYDGDNNGYPPSATAKGSWDGKFITTDSIHDDWLGNNQNDNLWKDVNGSNNPCPSGYRVPTIAEFDAERQTWSSNDRDGAYTSPLKLTRSGYREHLPNAPIYLEKVRGRYWTSNIDGVEAHYMGFHGSTTNFPTASRGTGRAIRCIKN